jgi:DNA-binding transcriptional ArsR family regulator
MALPVRVERAFDAFGDHTRRKIVERLSRGPASVSDLAKPLDVSLAAVTQHLQVLTRSGLVRTEKVGRVRTCHLDPAGLDIVVDWIGQCRSMWESRLDRLGELLVDSD